MARSLSSQDWYKSKGSLSLEATHSGDGTVQVRYMEAQIYISVTNLAAGETVTIKTPMDFKILDLAIHCATTITSRVLTLKNGSDTIEALSAVSANTLYRADSLADYLEFEKGDDDLIIAASGGSGDGGFFAIIPILDISKL